MMNRYFLCAVLSFLSFFAEANCQVLAPIPTNTSQLIIVEVKKGFQAEMITCERKGNRWKQVLKPFSVVIGEKGLALDGEKREGDLKTPAGLYPLGEAFGSKPLALKMDFKYLTAEDKYIDDPNSKLYNRWVFGKTSAKSYETMLRDEYQLGIVIDYNKNPTKPKAGSAIFIHLWRSPSQPTHGCIAMNRKDLLTILHWLDKSQHPYIFIYSRFFVSNN